MLLAVILPLGLAVASFAPQSPAGGEDGGPEPVCCHPVGPAEPLPPLPEGASPNERALRAIHDGLEGCGHAFLDRSLVEGFRARLAEVPGDAPVLERLGAEISLAATLMRTGELEESIERYERCAALARSDAGVSPALRTEVEYRLALAYFRLAERENCIRHHGQDSCIFPLAGGAVHVERRGATRASEVLEGIVERAPDYLEARWLWNVAHMALGTWPEGLPDGRAYPHETFASERPARRFLDVAPALGVSRPTRTGSVVADDFDGDGDFDLLTSSFDPSTPLALYENRDGTFAEVTAAAGLAHQLGGLELVHGDLDGDGLLDVLVLRGGGLYGAGEWPLSVLSQVAPLRFVDVTHRTGLDVRAPCRTAALADVDADGDLDVFVGCESQVGSDGELRYPSRLWRNDGGLRFTDVTAAAGIANRRSAFSAAFGDFDGDGDADLYVSNRPEENRLYRNRGDGTFEDVAPELGVVGPPFASAGAMFLDVDNDGDLDLFVASSGYAIRCRHVAGFHATGDLSGGTPRLYRNDGAGGFVEEVATAGLARVAHVAGVGAGDLDGDGFLDLYLATGAAEMDALWPNLMLASDRGRRFLDVTTSGGFGHLQKGRGVAFFDFDGDADDDVFLQTGGHHLDDAFGDVLFENPLGPRRWLGVRLRGVRSNRFGVGARVRARVRAGGAERDVVRFVGRTGTAGSGPLAPRLGLGEAEQVVALEVRWPSGATQRFEDVPLDRWVTVHEGSSELE